MKPVDLGCHSAEKSVDYPDFAHKLGAKLKNEFVIIGAHYDHIGKIAAVNGDDTSILSAHRTSRPHKTFGRALNRHSQGF